LSDTLESKKSRNLTQKEVTDNDITNIIDDDIKKCNIIPLYGVNLSTEPREEAPVWLQDIRDSLDPYSHLDDSIDSSSYGYYSWMNDIIDDLVEEAVTSGDLDRRKRKLGKNCTTRPFKYSKRDTQENSSPKYEADCSDDSDGLKDICARCVRRHIGGENECFARNKACLTCGVKGHLKSIHQVKDPDMRVYIAKELKLSDWDLWGRYAPEIVTIDEDDCLPRPTNSSDCLEIGRCLDSTPVVNTDCEESQGSSLYINPFHVDNDSESFIDNLEDEIEEVIDIADDVNPSSEANTKLDKLNHVNNLVGSFVNTQVAHVKEVISGIKKVTPLGTYVCNLCQVDCGTKENLKSHYRGKTHMKKLKSKACKDQLYCNICSIRTSGPDALLSHFEGKKHLKAVANMAQKRLAEPPHQDCESNDALNDDSIMSMLSERKKDVEIVDHVSNAEVYSSAIHRSKEKILEDIPDCFGKSLLILDKPNINLLPGNTWPLHKHSSFLEINKIQTSDDSETDSGQQIYEQFDQEVSKLVSPEEANLWCGVCQFGLDTYCELKVHIQSELHSKNILKRNSNVADKDTLHIDLTACDGNNDIIVVDDEDIFPRRLVSTPLSRPFRGFWPSTEVSKPLASTDGIFKSIKNFGFHSRPYRNKETHSKRNERRGVGTGNPSSNRVKDHSHKKTSWSRTAVSKWLNGTESSIGKNRDQVRLEGYRDTSGLEREAKLWASKNNSMATPNVQTDVVDLSSSEDEDIQCEDPTSSLVLDICDVRSLVTSEPSSVISETRQYASSNISESSETHSSSYLDDVSAHSELKYFKTGPLASLWSYECNVGPLISPEMGSSLREIYNRILMDPPSCKKFKGPVMELKVTYDLFLAENYKKSQNWLPDYRVIVQKFSSSIPDSKSLINLDQKYPDEVPFLFAVVNDGTVTFFNVDRLELPRYFKDI